MQRSLITGWQHPRERAVRLRHNFDAVSFRSDVQRLQDAAVSKSGFVPVFTELINVAPVTADVTLQVELDFVIADDGLTAATGGWQPAI